MDYENIKYGLLIVIGVFYAILLIYGVARKVAERREFTTVKPLGIKNPTGSSYYRTEWKVVVPKDDKEVCEVDVDGKVSHPSHYNRESLPECKELIDGLLDGYSEILSEYEIFMLGNVIKYIYRAPEKNGYEDIEKAAFYMKMLTEDR